MGEITTPADKSAIAQEIVAKCADLAAKCKGDPEYVRGLAGDKKLPGILRAINWTKEMMERALRKEADMEPHLRDLMPMTTTDEGMEEYMERFGFTWEELAADEAAIEARIAKDSPLSRQWEAIRNLANQFIPPEQRQY